jgi:hypothetical protein
MPYKDPIKEKEKKKRYYQKNKSNPQFKARLLSNARKWYQNHKEEMHLRNQKWAKTHRKELNAWASRQNSKQKLETLTYYGGNPPQCANPFDEHKETYTNILTLTMDYIPGGHGRKGWPFGRGLYYKLKREGYPKDWQVLCMNCQWIKRIKNKEVWNLREESQTKL